jgi:hypothetical protein
MEHVSGNIFIRENRLAPGGRITGHVHHFDHTSYVPKGRVRVRAWRPVRDVEGHFVRDHLGAVRRGEFLADREFGDGCDFGYWFLVKADVLHEITNVGTVDAVIHCIYSHRTPQGDVVQISTGWNAYTGGDEILQPSTDDEIRAAYGKKEPSGVRDTGTLQG